MFLSTGDAPSLSPAFIQAVNSAWSYSFLSPLPCKILLQIQNKLKWYFLCASPPISLAEFTFPSSGHFCGLHQFLSEHLSFFCVKHEFLKGSDPVLFIFGSRSGTQSHLWCLINVQQWFVEYSHPKK